MMEWYVKPIADVLQVSVIADHTLYTGAKGFKIVADQDISKAMVLLGYHHDYLFYRIGIYFDQGSFGQSLAQLIFKYRCFRLLVYFESHKEQVFYLVHVLVHRQNVVTLIR